MVKPGGVNRLRVDLYSNLPDRIRAIRLYEQPLGSLTQENVEKEDYKNLDESQR